MRTGFFRVLFRNYYITFPVIAFYLMFVTIANNKSWMLAYIFFFFACIAVICIIIKIIRMGLKKDLNNTPRWFRAQYEQYSRLAKVFYGNKEAIDNMLDNYNLELMRVENKKAKSSSHNFIIIVFFVIIGGLWAVYEYETNRFISNE